MPSRIPPEVWDRVRTLCLTLGPTGQPQYVSTSIAKQVNREFGLNLSHNSVARKIRNEGWNRERDAYVAEAMRRVETGERVPDPGDGYEGEPVRGQEGDESKLLHRTKLAILSHMEKYLSGTEQVTELALKALQFELYFHTQALKRVNALLRGGAEVLDPQVLSHRSVMLRPETLGKIAQLGQIMTSGQVSVALSHVQRIENKTLILQWGNDPYPDPPEPDAVREEAATTTVDPQSGEGAPPLPAEPEQVEKRADFTVPERDDNEEEE